MDSVWQRNKFPVVNLNRFSGARYKLDRPFCWTPGKVFFFGGRQFIGLYPCIAFETGNFGWVIQRTWAGMTIARE